jgi:signal transduction histidine kinase/CheY-like chemotaxis protein/ligand-binding sensor domain-containing protein
MYGISTRSVVSLCRDGNGFVWASSKTGVLRLSGGDCRIYQLPYRTADVVHVKLACRHTLVIACSGNGQFFRYNALHDRFDFMFDLRTLAGAARVSRCSLLIDAHDVLWIASDLGLHRYAGGELTLVSDAPDVQCAWYDSRHLLTTRAGGVWLVDVLTATDSCLYEAGSFPPFDVSRLFYDAEARRLWIGTVAGGLFYYDVAQGVVARPPVEAFPGQPVLAIEANSDSTLLVGIDGQGIWELNRAGDRVTAVYKEDADDPASLRGDGVYDILYDRPHNRVWVCTVSGGVSFFEQSSPPVTRLRHRAGDPNSLSNDNVNQVIEDSRGNLWFATNNGVSRLDVARDRWTAFYRNKQEQAQVFLSLCEDDRGRIWAGTYSSGVYVMDGKSGRELAHYSTAGRDSVPANDFVFDIYRDSRGDIWMGGSQGDIIRYCAEEDRFRTYPFHPIGMFAELAPGRILMACSYGLLALDAQSGQSEVLLGGYLLQDMLVADGAAWMCTDGAGLLRFDLAGREVERFTVRTGLPSNHANSIAQAGGYLWIGTENGLCRFSPGDGTAVTYASLWPLSNVSFNRDAHCLLRSGQLVFGTNEGAVIFDPSTLRQSPARGRIFLQDLTVSGRSVREETAPAPGVPPDSLQEITLHYHRNNLTAELLPLGTATGDARFSWMMEGLDADWSLPSVHRTPAYSHIPPGRFMLKIRMYDSSLSQVVAERRLAVRVIPPFWRAGWFRLLMCLAATGFAYFSLRFYVGRLKRRHAEDKVRFFTSTAHDIRTALTLIKAPVEELNRETNLSESGRYYLGLATEQARRLSSTASQLLDFQKADAGRGQLSPVMTDVAAMVAHRILMFESSAKSRNIELQFVADPPSYRTAVDESMMERVIDNLISNAIKYSHPGSPVHILFGGNAGGWTLEVKDRGIGISRKAQRRLFSEFYRGENAVNARIAGSGIGLLSARNYVGLHGGTIRCVSQENAGSSFRIAVPFRQVQGGRNRTVVAEQALTPAPERPPAPRKDTGRRGMHILIVEDNDDLRDFMRHPLGGEFDVSTAGDGAQAWEMIQTRMPDLIVSDVMMPGMDGFELCRRVKSTGESSHIPVILLTALTEKAQQLHGLGLGADDYLTKPFDMTLLTQRIRTIIQNRRTVREKALKLISGTHGDEPVLANEMNDKFVKKAVETVRAHMSDTGFGKDEFASAMNVSASLLYKKIKSLTDRSPVDFVRAIRLSHSLELLRSRKYTVTEVSEMCGFSSAAYFSTVFKKHFGESPTVEIQDPKIRAFSE